MLSQIVWVHDLETRAIKEGVNWALGATSIERRQVERALIGSAGRSYYSLTRGLLKLLLEARYANGRAKLEDRLRLVVPMFDRSMLCMNVDCCALLCVA